MTMTIRAGLFAAASAVALAAAAGAQAQSTVITAPNVTTASGSTSVTFRGYTYVNQGLVGVGRLSATGRDFANETLGSFSGMAIDLPSWRRLADGSYSGLLWTLPDRGPNDVGPFVGTTNYRNRIHTYSFTLNPYYSTTDLPAATTSQSQLKLTPTGGFFLTDSTGVNFTGRDAGSSTIVRGGITYPIVPAGDATGAAGRISMDSEAVARMRDGTFYVSDEYGAMIYYFDSTGKQIGAIQTVNALLPRVGGVINFDGANAPNTGRRNNQGLEALAITPDGKKLVTILQSATVQDTNGSNQQTRNNTRILIYDISQSRTPTAPIEHYVLQLPIFNVNGAGSANRTAAQSEMLALNSNQFLVLSRDGIGRGSGASATNSPVYKSVLLVDTFGATNLAGTNFETGTTAIATNGVLNAAITPVSQVELVNMLNPVQLGRFGMNLNTAPSNILSMSEKWEAMGLVPALDESKPQDFFLLIGNDNDFIAANGRINGSDFDASLNSVSGGSGNNDNIILVYRLTLPTYVDPEALNALKVTTPYALATAREAGRSLASMATEPGLRAVGAIRRQADLGGQAFGSGLNIWVEGGWAPARAAYPGGADFDADVTGGALGADYGFKNLRVGAAFASRTLSGGLGQGFDIDATGVSAGLYGGLDLSNDLYLETAWSYADVDYDKIGRPAAYGQIAQGSTKGHTWEIGGTFGYTPSIGGVRVGPFVSAAWRQGKIDGYEEHKASVSNATIKPLSFEQTDLTGGVEAFAKWGPVTPSIRIAYTAVDERGDEEASVRLTNAMHPMASTVVYLPGADDDYASAQLGLDGDVAGVQFRLQVETRVRDSDTTAGVTLGVSKRF